MMNASSLTGTRPNRRQDENFTLSRIRLAWRRAIGFAVVVFITDQVLGNIPTTYTLLINTRENPCKFHFLFHRKINTLHYIFTFLYFNDRHHL